MDASKIDWLKEHQYKGPDTLKSIRGPLLSLNLQFLKLDQL